MPALFCSPLTGGSGRCVLACAHARSCSQGDKVWISCKLLGHHLRGSRHGLRARAGVTEGLRVAAERLSSGFSGAAAALYAPQRRSDTLGARAVRALRAAPQALVAPLSGGAAAARAAILGARNALEPERYEDRRMAQ